MNFKTGDKVVVIAGKNKGKEGKIIKTLKAENRVVVEGVNVVKKTLKPNGQNPGNIIDMEAPIHASNVKIMDSKATKKVAVATEKKETKKKVTKKSKENID
ncbi:MAG: 50S ribosomal protein L24 [Bacilli bacterium]|nr:50S ribosomal protein L24 [Bacilli bacterium]